MTQIDVSKAAGYAAQAAKEREIAESLVRQAGAAVERILATRTIVENLLGSLHIPFQWVGTTLQLRGPDGEWVAGPDLKGEAGDRDAAAVPFAPTAGIEAENVQAAIEAAYDEARAVYDASARTAHTHLAANITDLSTTISAAISAAIDALIDGSPGALDTLNELAAALGDDANFASTVTTAIAARQAGHINLTALSGLTGAAAKVPAFTGAGAMALLGYGTGANELLQIRSDGRLPALDGSLLTNVGSLPGLNLISTQTVSSPVASVAFTGIDSAYDEYILKIYNVIPVTDSQFLHMLTSSNGGVSYDSGVSTYKNPYLSRDSASGTVSGVNNTATVRLSDLVGNGTNENGVSGVIQIFRPAVAQFVQFAISTVSVSGSGDLTMVSGVASRQAAAVVNAVQFLFASGNIASGTFRLYGVRKS